MKISIRQGKGIVLTLDAQDANAYLLFTFHVLFILQEMVKKIGYEMKTPWRWKPQKVFPNEPQKMVFLLLLHINTCSCYCCFDYAMVCMAKDHCMVHAC